MTADSSARPVTIDSEVRHVQKMKHPGAFFGIDILPNGCGLLSVIPRTGKVGFVPATGSTAADLYDHCTLDTGRH